MTRWKGYLQLLRPPNLFTALADILGGAFITFGLTAVAEVVPWLQQQTPNMVWLGLASITLYAGGVVLNDFFDAALDAEERPERPIPSGRVPARHALFLGVILLATGVGLAFKVSQISGFLALTIALLVLLYDAISKKNAVFGPLNMGLCRAANLLLGMSILGSLGMLNFAIATIPLIYIAAVTLISRGEVHGASTTTLNLGLALYFLVGVMLCSLQVLPNFQVLNAAPFIILFLLMTLLTAWSARLKKDPALVMRAVKMGVLALIPLNAALAAGFSGWIIGLLLLILLPLSLLTARLFAVT